MELGSLIELFLGSELERFFSSKEELKVGELLTGKVIELKQDGKVLIDFLKFRAVAKVKFQLPVGAKINVKLVEKGENLKFEVVNNNSGIIAETKEIIEAVESRDSVNIVKLVEKLQDLIENKNFKIPENEKSKVSNNEKISNKIEEYAKPTEILNKTNTKNKIKSDNKVLRNEEELKLPQKIQESIISIKNQFKPFEPAEDILKISLKLKKQIMNSGFFFEDKIAKIISKLENLSEKILSDLSDTGKNDIKKILQNDLKPNLFILKEFFDEMEEIKTANKDLKNIRKTIDDLIENIESQQRRGSKENIRPNQLQYITVQIPMKNKEKAKLRIYYDKEKKRKSKAKGFNLSLLLVMDRLKEIRVDFFLLEKDLNITIFVGREDIKREIYGRLEYVRNNLEELFRFLNISVKVSKRKIRDFDNEVIYSEGIKRGLVDLSV